MGWWYHDYRCVSWVTISVPDTDLGILVVERVVTSHGRNCVLEMGSHDELSSLEPTRELGLD